MSLFQRTWRSLAWVVFVGCCWMVTLVALPHETEAQTTARVSVNSNGVEGEKESQLPAMSGDGRFIVFQSRANSLVSGDTNASDDIFVHDRDTRQTTRASVKSNGEEVSEESFWPTISADGNVVAFHSDAGDLVPGDTNEWVDTFVHDRITGQTTRVSVNSNGGEGNRDSYGSTPPALSADGRFVAFVSEATNLVAGDTNGTWDIFVRDRQTGQTTRVSVDSSGIEAEASTGSFWPTISRDGRYVAFTSWAENLVAGDTNDTPDVFVHDRETNKTTRVSLTPTGAQRAEISLAPFISGDGRYVTYYTSVFAPGVYVYDQQTGITTKVPDPTAAFSISGHSTLSGDGRYVAFEDTVLGQSPRHTDTFVYDQQTGQTNRVSSGLNGQPNDGDDSGLVRFSPRISDDGRFIAFDSTATNLVPRDTNGFKDIFVHDRGALMVGSSADSDLDGDSKDDLLWRNTTSGAVAVWLMNGTRMKSSGFLGGVSPTWQIAGKGDVDGNGTADVLWRNTANGVVAVWFMNGRRVSSMGFSGSTSTDWTIIGMGDLDGNGKADLFWRNRKSGQVAAWLMNGATIATSGFLGTPPLDVQFAGLGDVNGDGKTDVIWFNTGTGAVSIWQMDGLSISAIGMPGRTSTDWTIQGVGDLDGNGTADLLWRNASSGLVAAWLLAGSTIASSGFFGGVPTKWEIAQVGDVDGNGKADVIWRNSANGVVAVWLMNGLSISSVGFPGSASTVWEIQN